MNERAAAGEGRPLTRSSRRPSASTSSVSRWKLCQQQQRDYNIDIKVRTPVHARRNRALVSGGSSRSMADSALLGFAGEQRPHCPVPIRRARDDIRRQPRPRLCPSNALDDSRYSHELLVEALLRVPARHVSAGQNRLLSGVSASSIRIGSPSGSFGSMPNSNLVSAMITRGPPRTPTPVHRSPARCASPARVAHRR